MGTKESTLKVVVDKCVRVDYYFLCPACESINRSVESDFYELQNDDDKIVTMIDCRYCGNALEVSIIITKE